MVASSIANYTSVIAELIQDEVLQFTEEDRENIKWLGLGWRGIESIRPRGVVQRIEGLLTKLERDFLAIDLEIEALKNRAHGFGTNNGTRSSDSARKRYIALTCLSPVQQACRDLQSQNVYL